MIICVAVATKSMTAKTTTREHFSQKEFQDKIDFLSQEIVSLSDDLRASTLVSIISTAEVVLEYSRLQAKRYDSGRTRFGILNALITHGGNLTLTEISKRVFRSKYSTTRVIDKLVKDDLVTREVINSDRRAKNIIITRKGIAFIEETMPNRQKMTNEVTSCLTRSQMIALMGLLKKLKKHLLGIIALQGPDFRSGVETC
jgi:MarR family transcriptional regulator, 2-MHQ and catechol-resistance regulon repressor